MIETSVEVKKLYSSSLNGFCKYNSFKMKSIQMKVIKYIYIIIFRSKITPSFIPKSYSQCQLQLFFSVSFTNDNKGNSFHSATTAVDVTIFLTIVNVETHFLCQRDFY